MAFNKVPMIMQMYRNENGIAILQMMMGTYDKYVPISELRKYCVISKSGMAVDNLCKAAEYYKLDVEVHNISAQEVMKLDFPLVIRWNKNGYVVVRKIRSNRVYLSDPAKGEYKVNIEKFEASYGGIAISYKPGDGFESGGKRPSVIGSIYRRIKDYMGTVRMMFIVTAVITLLGLYQVTLKKEIMDTAMMTHEIKTALLPLVLMLVVTLVTYWISERKIDMLYETSRKMSYDSAKNMFRHVLLQPLEFYETFNRGDMMDRITNNMTLDNDLLSKLVPKILSSVMTVLYIVLMFRYNKTISIVCLLIELAFIIIILCMQKRLDVLQKSMVWNTTRSQSLLTNGIDSLDTIRASGFEREFFTYWSRQQQGSEYDQTNIKRTKSVISFMESMESVVTSAILLMMGAYFIIQGEFTVGMLSAFQSIFSNFSGSLSSIVEVSDTIQTMKTDIERIDDICDRDIEEIRYLAPGEEPVKLSGQINISNVSYRYNEGDEPAISDISVNITPGEMIALVGSSGCGKSTLMKVVAGLYKPATGEITYDGKEFKDIPEVVFRSSMSMVEQEPYMFQGSIRENLRMLDQTISDEDIIEAAKDACIHERIDKNRYGYDSMIFENGKNYSGGEMQRMELARALSVSPTIMLLDEFTSALDAITEEKVFRSLRDRNITCIVAAHRLSTVTQCDRILVIDHGKIVEEGTHKELYEANGRYRQLIDKH